MSILNCKFCNENIDTDLVSMEEHLIDCNSLRQKILNNNKRKINKVKRTFTLDIEIVDKINFHNKNNKIKNCSNFVNELIKKEFRKNIWEK